MQFPSETPFVSYLQYAPKGKSAMSAYARLLTYSLKDDKWATFVQPGGVRAQRRAIPHVAQRLSEAISGIPCFSGVFSAGALLVPVPRSAPLVGSDALWPTKKICEAMVENGLGDDTLPLLIRKLPVQKSSTAEKGARPSPPVHYGSVAIDRGMMPLVLPSKLILVDDVVTRGATFVGMLPKLVEAFPGIPVECFAMIRTASEPEVTTIVAPVRGKITYGFGSIHRSP